MLLALSPLPSTIPHGSHGHGHGQGRSGRTGPFGDQDRRPRPPLLQVPLASAPPHADIVSAEGEGCSAAGWEGTSEGDGERGEHTAFHV